MRFWSVLILAALFIAVIAFWVIAHAYLILPVAPILFFLGTAFALFISVIWIRLRFRRKS